MSGLLETLRGWWRRVDAISPWLRMAALLLAFTAVLAGMIWQQQRVLATGREIVLKVRPFDPRDLLLGHYVRLQFDISRIPASAFADTPDEIASAATLRGREVYVVLRKDASSPFWTLARAHWKRPATLSPEEALLKGRVEWLEGGTRVHVRYGFERYYAPKQRALELENLVRERWRLDSAGRGWISEPGATPPGIILKVDEEGRGIIAGWLIDGERVMDERLF